MVHQQAKQHIQNTPLYPFFKKQSRHICIASCTQPATLLIASCMISCSIHWHACVMIVCIIVAVGVMWCVDRQKILRRSLTKEEHSTSYLLHTTYIHTFLMYMHTAAAANQFKTPTWTCRQFFSWMNDHDDEFQPFYYAQQGRHDASECWY